MPRRETPFLPDCYYHFYNRGNNRQPIFFEIGNYLFFLRGLKRYLTPAVSIIAYCLMPNHFHILAQVNRFEPSENTDTSDVSAQVSHAMQNFLISYTKAVNKRYRRVGSLFQGQFQAKPIWQYEHLLRLCIYIHVNPVKDGLVTAPQEWPYSNYLEWMDQREDTIVDRDFVREHFSTPQEYCSLVTDYLQNMDMPDDLRKYLQSLED